MNFLKKIKEYFITFIKVFLSLIKDPKQVHIAIRFLEAVLESLGANKSKAKKGPKFLYGNIGQDVVKFFEDNE